MRNRLTIKANGQTLIISEHENIHGEKFFSVRDAQCQSYWESDCIATASTLKEATGLAILWAHREAIGDIGIGKANIFDRHTVADLFENNFDVVNW